MRMGRLIVGGVCWCGLASMVLGGQGHAFSRYELIIAKEPFGAMAADAPAEGASAPMTAEQEEQVNQIVQQISLCAMTIMPDGRTAVGVIDSSQQPVAYTVLFDGDEYRGLSVVFSDYEEELATFEKDGLAFTLKLGKGLVETVTAESLEAERAAKALAEAEVAEPEPERRPFNSPAEQLIAMQMSLPPNIEAPPLPMIVGDVAQLTKKFDETRADDEEPQDDLDEVVKAGVEELKAAAQEGESAQSYIQRLTEHRQQEVKRQQEEQAVAQQVLEEEEAQAATDEDAEYLRRRTNIELIKKGVVPLDPVELTHEEEKELSEAGVL